MKNRQKIRFLQAERSQRGLRDVTPAALLYYVKDKTIIRDIKRNYKIKGLSM